MIKADYHVHSEFSSDSQTSMKEMIEKAIELNFSRICFTDHMDYDYPKVYGESFTFDPMLYFQTLTCLQNKYQGKIRILNGIEIGMQPYLADKYKQLINKYPFDFVICSTHLVNNIDPYYNDYWIDKTQDKGITDYLKTITENISVYRDFDVYGHIDYILRYCQNRPENFYQKYADYIDTALIHIIQAGKAIEVNTSGYKYGLGYPNPHEDIIKRYLELGGELITIGSDAHQPEYFGFSFKEVKNLLLSLGFRYYTVFEQRKPIMELL